MDTAKKITKKLKHWYTMITLEQNIFSEITVMRNATLITYKKQSQKIIVFLMFSLDNQQQLLYN